MAKKAAKKPKKPQNHGIDLLLLPFAVPIDSLTFDSANARKHSTANLQAIKASLVKFGQDRPILVREQTRHVVAGNGTLAAAIELGWTHIAAVVRPLTDQDSIARAIADNQTTDLSEWDYNVLLPQIEAIRNDSPELAKELSLLDLLPAPPEERPAVTVPEVYGLNIDCGSEAEQQKFHSELAVKRKDEMAARGIKIKLVTM